MCGTCVGLRSGGGWDVCETCHIAIAAMCDHAMCDSESVSRNVLVLLRVGEKVLFRAPALRAVRFGRVPRTSGSATSNLS